MNFFKKVEIPAGSLVLSHGHLPYQPVLDDFSFAENIRIATYNVSWDDPALLDALDKTDANVRIITNIPNRFPSYFGDRYRRKASDTIAKYMTILDPHRFSPIVEVFFFFSNHSKIVMTDNVAFIGSANYSSESMSNWECGVLIQDEATITALEEAFDDMAKQAVRYYGGKMRDVLEPLMKVRQQVNESREALNDKVTECVMNDIGGAIDALREAISFGDKTWRELGETNGPLCSVISMEEIVQIENTIQHSEELRRLAAFDPDDITGDDLPSDADEENLDRYIEAVVSQRASHYDCLLDQAQPVLDGLIRRLEAIGNQIETAAHAISASYKKIDNTRA